MIVARRAPKMESVMTAEGEMDGRVLLLEESGVDIVINEVTVSRVL